MSNPLRTPDDYELFLYTLGEQFLFIRQSTIVFARLGATLARVAGELYFDQDIRLVVRQRLLYHRLPAVIDWYGYEIWQGDTSCTGTILSPTLMIQLCKARTPITSTRHRTQNTTAFRLQR